MEYIAVGQIGLVLVEAVVLMALGGLWAWLYRRH